MKRFYKSKQNALTANGRFGAMAAVSPQTILWKIARYYPAASSVEAATAPSRWDVMRHLRRTVQYGKKLWNKLKECYQRKEGEVRLFLSGKLYVSFGENCLTDNILGRHGLKSLTTPFSHGRSNVEYILNLEKDDYTDFLNLDYLEYEELSGKMVPRLKKYNSILNEYHNLHKNGFEFTHHDVIKDEKVRAKIRQRVFNLKNYIDKKKIVIFYHHRLNDVTNKDLLIRHLCELRNIYSTKTIKSEIICFTQKIISNFSERSVSYSKKGEVHFFVFNTMNEWEGNDPEIFWARCDEDLIKEMIFFAKRIKNDRITGGLAQAGQWLARKFVQIYKFCARPNGSVSSACAKPLGRCTQAGDSAVDNETKK